MQPAEIAARVNKMLGDALGIAKNSPQEFTTISTYIKWAEEHSDVVDLYEQSTLFYGIVEQVRNNQIRCLLAGSLRCVKRLSRDRVLPLFLVCIMEDKKLLNFPQY
jgi:hypothetical protein